MLSLSDIKLLLSDIKNSEVANYYLVFDKWFNIQLNHTSNSNVIIDLKNSLVSNLEGKIETVIYDLGVYPKHVIDSLGGEQFFIKTLTELKIKCFVCDSFLRFKLDNETYCEVSELNCFDFGIKQYSIHTKSGKFIIMNDVRNYISTVDHSKASVNSYKGQYNVTSAFAKDDMLFKYVGNTSIKVYQNTDALYLSNLDIKGVARKGNNSICCDLWWISGTDIDNVDYNLIKKEKIEHIIVDLEPNSEYIFTENYEYDDNCDLGYTVKLEKVN